jgi:hypothetical protein
MPIMILKGNTSRPPTRSHLQSCGVDSHRTRCVVTVAVLDRVNDDYVLDARMPEGEGACHARRPCSNNKDSCARGEGHRIKLIQVDREFQCRPGGLNIPAQEPKSAIIIPEVKVGHSHGKAKLAITEIKLARSSRFRRVQDQ